MCTANFGIVIDVCDYLKNEFPFSELVNVTLKKNKVEITLHNPTSSRTFESLTYHLSSKQLEDWCGMSFEQFHENYLVFND